MKLIYSFKASGNGNRMSGRVAAVDMADATKQVAAQLWYPNMNVSITLLANQTLARKQWEQRIGALWK